MKPRNSRVLARTALGLECLDDRVVPSRTGLFDLGSVDLSATVQVGDQSLALSAWLNSAKKVKIMSESSQAPAHSASRSVVHISAASLIKAEVRAATDDDDDRDDDRPYDPRPAERPVASVNTGTGSSTNVSTGSNSVTVVVGKSTGNSGGGKATETVETIVKKVEPKDPGKPVDVKPENPIVNPLPTIPERGVKGVIETDESHRFPTPPTNSEQPTPPRGGNNFVMPPDNAPPIESQDVGAAERETAANEYAMPDMVAAGSYIVAMPMPALAASGAMAAAGDAALELAPAAAQTAGVLARFLPFDPSELQESVDNFLNSLRAKSLEDGAGFTFRTAVWWAAGLIGAIVTGEIARRKKVVSRSRNWLSLTLSKWLTIPD